MTVYMVAFGTRGDVQPFVALGRALRDAGQDALLAGPARYGGLAAAYGVPFAPVDDQWNRMTEEPAIQRALATNYAGPHGKRAAVHVVRRTREYLTSALDDVAAAAPRGTDVVVHHTMVPGQHLAEALGATAVPVTLQPNWIPTGAFACPLGARWARPWWPAWLNRASHRVGALAPRALLGRTGAHWRRRLGLRPRRGSGDPFRGPDGSPALVLQAFSDAVLPQPPDWPAHAPVTGYWFTPPVGDTGGDVLERFLADGPPPVYLGFGSMRGQEPALVGDMVRRLVRATGLRAVVATGGGGIALDDEPGSILVVDDVPHDVLLGRAAAVVHHGGAGTTAGALRAGRPQVICPFTGDQPFWGTRMHALGVAPRPLPQSDLDAESLIGAVATAATDPALADRARDLGARIRAENGTAAAVRLLAGITAPAGRAGNRAVPDPGAAADHRARVIPPVSSDR